MRNLLEIPNKLEKKHRLCRAIIETPKSHRNKFNYDSETNLFKLGGLLPEGMMFPFDFGFIPATLGEDGDPLDVMVIMDEPASCGSLIDVRIIGVIEAKQTQDGKTKTNDRLLAVAVHSYAHEKTMHIKELSSDLIKQIEQFFVAYNIARHKKFKVTSRGGPKSAMAVLMKGIKAFKQSQA